MTHRTSRRSLIAALGAAPLAASGVLAAAGPAHADPDAGSSRRSRIPDGLRPGGELDRYLAELVAADAFSGTVLVSHWDKPVFSRSYQMADKERQIPNGPDTVFCIASITKLFTSVAIAQLAAQGKIRYDATLGTYLDGFAPEIANKVTMHHLLTHTSGVGRPHTEADTPGWDDWADSLDDILAGTVDFIRGLKPNFPPGTEFMYTNDAYIVLGAIVARVSGQSYHEYLREHIFEAADMANSDVCTLAEWQEDRRIAHPYLLENGTRIDSVEANREATGNPAGGVFTTAPDLVRFVNALRPGQTDNRVLSRDFTYIITSPKQPMNGVFGGYGPAVGLVNGQWIVALQGGTRSMSNNLEWYPGTGWATVVLGNYRGASDLVNDKAREIILGL